MAVSHQHTLCLSIFMILGMGCAPTLKPYMKDSSIHPVYGQKSKGAYMHAVGHGTSHSAALKNAKRKISEQLQSNIKSRTTISSTYNEADGKSVTTESGQDTVIVDSSFEFAELIKEDMNERIIIEENDLKVHYVYVYMAKDDCIKSLKKSMKDKLQIIGALSGEVDKAKSQGRLNILKNLMVQASEVSKEIEKINRQAYAVRKKDLTSAHHELTKRLFEAYTSLKGRTKVGVKVHTDSSQLKGLDVKKIEPIVKKLEGQALKAISELGLESKLGSCESDVDYSVQLVIKSSCRLSGIGQRCSASSSGELIDCSNGAVIRSLDFTARKTAAVDRKRKVALNRLASSYTGTRDKEGLKEIVSDVFHYEIGDKKTQ